MNGAAGGRGIVVLDVPRGLGGFGAPGGHVGGGLLHVGGDFPIGGISIRGTNRVVLGCRGRIEASERDGS